MNNRISHTEEEQTEIYMSLTQESFDRQVHAPLGDKRVFIFSASVSRVNCLHAEQHQVALLSLPVNKNIFAF